MQTSRTIVNLTKSPIFLNQSPCVYMAAEVGAICTKIGAVDPCVGCVCARWQWRHGWPISSEVDSQRHVRLNLSFEHCALLEEFENHFFVWHVKTIWESTNLTSVKLETKFLCVLRSKRACFVFSSCKQRQICQSALPTILRVPRRTK